MFQEITQEQPQDIKNYLLHLSRSETPLTRRHPSILKELFNLIWSIFDMQFDIDNNRMMSLFLVTF